MNHGISRRTFARLAVTAGCWTVAMLRSEQVSASVTRDSGVSFVHPGMLHSAEDLKRMKVAVERRSNPIYSGFLVLQRHPLSSPRYSMHGGQEEIGRNPNVNIGEFNDDANACYQCAIMFAVTQDRRYADVSRRIARSWSLKLKRITGRDAILAAGLGPFKMLNGAEILRSLDPVWQAPDTEQFASMVRHVVYPVLKDYALFANGNWDTAALKCVLASGVFLDDRSIFENALQYYRGGSGDGQLTHYIYPSGQCQESGRDQQHTQLGIGHMGDSCEISWNQGLDLYGCESDRLLTGFEYTAKYNLGNDVPFIPDCDRTGKYRHWKISPLGRGRLRPIYEQIYNHYQNRVGILAPWTARAAAKLRPSGAGPGADQTGFGTLLYTRPKHGSVAGNVILHPPGGLLAKTSAQGISLTWIRVNHAQSYTVFRAGAPTGLFKPIGETRSPAFHDQSVRTGEVYRYKVIAASEMKKTRDSQEVAICAGLPDPWREQAIGEGKDVGGASFDGQTWKISGGGETFYSGHDTFRYVFTPVTGSYLLTARFVPQEASSFAQFGVVFRSSLAPDGDHASLLIVPHMQHGPEDPTWKAILLVRRRAGHLPKVIAEYIIPAPIAIYGRLMNPFELRLQYVSGTVVADVSCGNDAWTHVGKASVSWSGSYLAGLGVCSGLKKIATTVKYDRVTIGQSKPNLKT